MNMTFCVIGWQWIFVVLASTATFLKSLLAKGLYEPTIPFWHKCI